MKKKIKKRKIRIVPIIITILLILIVSFLVFSLFKIKIKNIYVTGNKLLTEEEIIVSAKLDNYPSFLGTTSYRIKKNILSNEYIKSVKVTKSLLATVNIEVEEYDGLFIKDEGNIIVLDTDKEIPNDNRDLGLPILVNYVPDIVYDKFINEMNNVDISIRKMISNIEYSPNEYDKQRFLLYMNDGNLVYVTITRFNLINSYKDIYPSLNNKKGILYLDSGNHFEIKG